MVRTKLHFDVEDKEYFNRLQQYIIANYSAYFEIVHNVGSTSDICIVSDYINRRNRKGIFLIKEEKGDISKFRSAADICSELMKMNSFGAGNTIYNKKTKTTKICITSASGGVGKSTIAQAMCCSLAVKGKKVLYINSNPFASCEHIFKDTAKNAYTRFRYYIRNKDRDISGRIKSLVCRSNDRRVDYIVNKQPSADGFISRNEVEWLISEIDRGCSYDIIVFDIPSYPGNGHLELMKCSDKTFLIYSIKVDQKHEEFLRYLQSEGVCNSVCVTNYAEDGENTVPEAEDIFIAHPDNFWRAIERICDVVGEKNEKSY